MFRSIALAFASLLLVAYFPPQATGSELGEVQFDAGQTSVERRGRWHVVASKSFRIWSLESAAEAQLAVQRCEQAKRLLYRSWGGTGDGEIWMPRCEVVLHDNLQSYVQAVGHEGRQTMGSSYVHARAEGGKHRRIDLRMDMEGSLSTTLNHEMSHVVLADRFGADGPPAWLDEGIAVLSDPVSKQRMHERDLLHAMHSGRAFPLIELLSMPYPRSERWALFYGQSTSFIRFLLTIGTPEQLMTFVDQIDESGVADSLQSTYDVSGVFELENAWRRYVAEGPDWRLVSNP